MTLSQNARPKIYCFTSALDGGDGIAYALAEDGTVLGSHWCSHEDFVPYDLGVVDGYRTDRHESYKTHYSNGYEMEFVKAAEVDGHKGLQAAIRRNQEDGEDPAENITMTIHPYQTVLTAIQQERCYQDRKYGTAAERQRSIGDYLTILRQELAEAETAFCRETDEAALLEILQVVAVGVACLEQHGVVERSENGHGPGGAPAD